jgi:uncharacterized UBP type Zn finger protein
MEKKICSHILSVKEVIPPAERVCDECVKSDGRWVHLRTCQTCGTTLCCDSSPHKHATAHFQATGHPVVISAEPGEKWLWCYADESFASYS